MLATTLDIGKNSITLPPHVMSVKPLFGPRAGGTQLNITMNNFDMDSINNVYLAQPSEEIAMVCINLVR